MKEPKTCPFCGISLIWQEDTVDLGYPCLMRYWWHPSNGCFLDRAEVSPDDIPAWNQRV